MNKKNKFITNDFGIKTKNVKPSALYKKMNLLQTSSYRKFIIKLVEELTMVFNNVGFTSTGKKSYVVIDSVNDFIYKTPPIEGFIIEVDNCFELEFHPLCKGICLFTFEVDALARRQGIGSILMNTMIDISNKYEIPIYLIPIQTTEEVTYDTLKRFYHSFGYVRSSRSRYWVYEPEINIKMVA